MHLVTECFHLCVTKLLCIVNLCCNVTIHFALFLQLWFHSIISYYTQAYNSPCTHTYNYWQYFTVIPCHLQTLCPHRATVLTNNRVMVIPFMSYFCYFAFVLQRHCANLKPSNNKKTSQ